MNDAVLVELTKRKLKLDNGRITVGGSSMEKIIRDGDEVCIEVTNEYKTGNVTLVVYNSKIVVHRIVKISKDFIYTKGDNCVDMEKVKMENCIGIVKKIQNRHMKYGLKDKIIAKFSIRVHNIWKKDYSIEKALNSFGKRMIDILQKTK